MMEVTSHTSVILAKGDLSKLLTCINTNAFILVKDLTTAIFAKWDFPEVDNHIYRHQRDK